jgi:hypothetical protein
MWIIGGIIFMFVFIDWYERRGPGAGCLAFLFNILVVSVCVWIVFELFGSIFG